MSPSFYNTRAEKFKSRKGEDGKQKQLYKIKQIIRCCKNKCNLQSTWKAWTGKFGTASNHLAFLHKNNDLSVHCLSLGKFSVKHSIWGIILFKFSTFPSPHGSRIYWDLCSLVRPSYTFYWTVCSFQTWSIHWLSLVASVERYAELKH